MSLTGLWMNELRSILLEAEFFIWNSNPVDSRHFREEHGVQQVQVWSRDSRKWIVDASRPLHSEPRRERKPLTSLPAPLLSPPAA